MYIYIDMYIYLQGYTLKDLQSLAVSRRFCTLSDTVHNPIGNVVRGSCEQFKDRSAERKALLISLGTTVRLRYTR